MMRNYRQIVKSDSQVKFIAVGKSQGGKYQLGEPKIYINAMPRIPIKTNYRYIPPLPFKTFTIEKE